MASLFCQVCGTENPPTRQFCRKCASDLRAPAPNPNTPVAPQPTPVPVRPIVIGGGIALVVVVLTIALLVVLGGSPAASPSPAPSLTPAPATASALPIGPASAPPTFGATAAPSGGTGPTEQPAPVIRSFVGPVSVDCTDPGFNGFIHLSWRVGFADGATLAIDGPGLYKTYRGVLGEDDVPFSCGGESHTYTLTTVGGNGPAATRTLVIGQPG